MTLLINKNNPLILASASPRRKDLLTQAQIPFKSMASHVPEDGETGSPGEITCCLARKKAQEVFSRSAGSWTLGTDTVVAVDLDPTHGGDAMILGKPANEEDGARMLRLISGKWHRVITGFAILNPEGIMVHQEPVTTLVEIKALSDIEIQAYLGTGEPFDKAGSYAIQGIGAFMVKGISGSYTNVVGLPLYAVIRALVKTGALKNYPNGSSL